MSGADTAAGGGDYVTTGEEVDKVVATLKGLKGAAEPPKLKISEIKNEAVRFAANSADHLSGSPDGDLTLDELYRAQRLANDAIREAGGSGYDLTTETGKPRSASPPGRNREQLIYK
jgi:hypothetical protein